MLTIIVHLKDDGSHDHSVSVEDIWRGLESVYEKKLTRAIGISNFNVGQTERILKVAKIPIHNIQVSQKRFVHE